MTDHLTRARHYHSAIQSILLRDWDPIGVSHHPQAQDEYERQPAAGSRQRASASDRESVRQ
jgi:hypothetical protein